MNPKTVVVLGASPKESRYSNMAAQELLSRGYGMIPVRPGLGELMGEKAYANLVEVGRAGIRVDTVTVYVGPEHSSAMAQEMIDLQPRRVIFNPGAENPALEKQLQDNGIETLAACTLVLLRTQQF